MMASVTTAAASAPAQPANPPGNTAWYLVHCRPQQEQRALEHLQNQLFDCFLPWLNCERIRRGKREQHREPLFPGYLFVHLHSVEQNWGNIRSTRGVRQLVRFGDSPATVPQAIIDSLQQSANINHNKPAFQAGEKLRITQGPFAQQEALFHQFDGNERVIVLLQLLQQQHRLTLKLSDISKQ